MRMSLVGTGAVLATMSICTLLGIGAAKQNTQELIKQQQQTPSSITINNDNSVHYENSFNGNTSDYDYNNNEDYDIDIQAEENNTQDTTNENSTINPPVQSVQPTQDKQQKTQQKTTTQNQPQQKSTTASSLKNNINNNTTSTTEETSNNTSDKGITLRQPEKQEIPAKQPDTCEYCGETGKLHGNLRVWMDTNGTDHTTHNKDCTKAYINSTGIQPDSELELD